MFLKTIILNLMEKLNTKYEATIVKKFASTYASIFMDKIETNFLGAQELKPFSMMLSLLGHMVKKNGKSFQKILMTNTPALNLPMSSIEKAFPFWTKR